MTGEDCIRSLLFSLAKQDGAVRLAIHRCEELDDPVTQDALLDVAAEIETDSWMLQSHLEPRQSEATAPRFEQAQAPA